MTTSFDSLFARAAAAYSVPAWLLEALARRESSLNPNQQVWEPTVSEYSWGLGGLLESTARALGYTGPAEGLKDAGTNIDLMGRYARDIVARQGGLNLADFYSEWNSGRSTLWQTSTEVANHVRLFLQDVATSIGRTLPAGFSIDQALSLLETAAPANNIGLIVVAIAAIVFWMRR